MSCHSRQLNVDSSIQIKVGKRIAELRKEKNISQQELAAICNFEKSNLSRLEAGRVNPTLLTLEKICKGLDVGISELFKF